MTNTIKPLGLTYDQCQLAAANYGIDLSCGECAAVFYTGAGGFCHEAECKTALTRYPELSDREASGLRQIRTGDVTSPSEAEMADRWIDRVLAVHAARRLKVKAPEAP